MTGISSHVSSSRVLMRHARDIMDNIALFTMRRSEGFLSIANAAASLTKRMVDSGIVAGADKESMEQYFFNQLDIYPQFSGIYFGSLDGQFFYVCRYNKDEAAFRTKIIEPVNDGKGLTTRLTYYDARNNILSHSTDPNDSYDPRTRPWFEKALEKNGLIWTDPYIFFTAQKPGITTAAPVTREDGSPLGVVGIDIEIDDLSIFLSRLSIGKHGKAFILHPNGNVLAHSNLEMITTGDAEGKSTQLPRITAIMDPLARLAFASSGLSFGDNDQLSLAESRFSSFEYEGAPYMAMFHPFAEGAWPWIIGLYMPEDDYLGALKENRQNTYYIAIFFTILATLLALLLSRTISKPIQNLERGAVAIRNHDLETTFDTSSIYREIQETADAFNTMRAELKKLQGELNRSHHETIIRLAAVAEFKDRDTAQHLHRVSDLAVIMARELGLPSREVELIKNASPMHDVGKMGVPDAILMKPGPLTPEEREVIERHPLYGADILSHPESELMRVSHDIALMHHERWDGKGYPNRLAGEEINLPARIVALVDVFDAVMSERCYKSAIPFDEAVKIVQQERGRHFDPLIADAFMRRLDEIRKLYSN